MSAKMMLRCFGILALSGVAATLMGCVSADEIRGTSQGNYLTASGPTNRVLVDTITDQGNVCTFDPEVVTLTVTNNPKSSNVNFPPEDTELMGVIVETIELGFTFNGGDTGAVNPETIADAVPRNKVFRPSTLIPLNSSLTFDLTFVEAGEKGFLPYTWIVRDRCDETPCNQSGVSAIEYLYLNAFYEIKGRTLLGEEITTQGSFAITVDDVCP